MTASTLAELYQRTSKHSQYQVLPSMLAPLLDPGTLLQVHSRSERERLAYIVAHLPLQGLHVADIGGNTGFFSFEALTHGARQVDYFEGNTAHHDFVQAAARQLGQSDRLRTHARYVTFQPGDLPMVDCTLLLNVLHHLGDDFGDPATAKETAKAQMLGCLNNLARTSGLLVFQLGFNWKGDRHQPLFEQGTKSELIDFIQQGTAHDWEVRSIGIAQRRSPTDQAIVFEALSPHNIARDDSLGEFLNRPLFIMRSRHFP